MVSRELHIAISARAMSLPMGGVKEYLMAMIPALLNAGSHHHFSVYYDDQKFIDCHNGVTAVYLYAPHKFLWDHWVLPKRLEKDRPDVVWFPHNVVSIGLSIPSVVSVMDMLYFRPPEYNHRVYGRVDSIYMRTFIRRSLHKAHQIMAISDWTAYDIQRLVGVPAQKLNTIHLAASPEYQLLPKSDITNISRKFNLSRPFFLYVGTLNPRKNVRTLIEAFARIKEKVPHDLVLAGSSLGIVPESDVENLIGDLGITHRVHKLGFVPKWDLVGLYNIADAFVFPSFYEGFGLPALEAMACGCPVISSSATSLPEVVGNAALMFEPNDIELLAAHLESIACDEMLRQRLSQSGLERSQQFTYTGAASNLLELLESTAVRQ